MNTKIFRTVAGSRLFGTTTPDSDWDFKGVYLPSPRAILSQKASKVLNVSTATASEKNTAKDIDETYFPLHKYVDMLTGMETNAVEMLFARNMLDGYFSDDWKELYDNRYRFLSSNRAAFAGFGKAQAMRYAVRGDRVATLSEVVATLAMYPDRARLVDLHTDDLIKLSSLEGVEFGKGADGTDCMKVFGRQVPLRITIAEAAAIYQKPLDEAGKRTKQAMENGGADWKGLYHAHRIVDEGIEYLTTGRMTFPCPNAAYYREVRAGNLPLDAVLETFLQKLEHLESVEPNKMLREEPDLDYAELFVARKYGQHVEREMHAVRL